MSGPFGQLWKASRFLSLFLPELVADLFHLSYAKVTLRVCCTFFLFSVSTIGEGVNIAKYASISFPEF